MKNNIFTKNVLIWQNVIYPRKNDITQDVWHSNCCAIAYVVLSQKNWRALVCMNWIDSHRSVKGATVGNCMMNRLLFANGLVLHAWIFSTGPSACIWSVFCCVRPSRNENQKVEVLCLSRRPWQCLLQVSGNTLQQVEACKYLGVVFTSDGNRNKGIDTLIGKANAVLRELYCSEVTKREFQRAQSFQFLNRSLFRSSPVIMNVTWRLKE